MIHEGFVPGRARMFQGLKEPTARHARDHHAFKFAEGGAVRPLLEASTKLLTMAGDYITTQNGDRLKYE